MPYNTEEESLHSSKQEQTEGFERIYQAYKGRVYNFVCGMIKDPSIAKDLTQDVFIQIWNSRERLNYANNLNAYIFTIAKNSVYLYIKRELLLQNYVAQKKEEPDNITLEFEKKLDDEALEKNIFQLIEKLPKARREIFLLYWKADMNYREIALKLSISEKTVATQVRRTLQFIKENLDSKLLSFFIFLFIAPI